MTIEGIIEAVRLCIDEEALNGSDLNYDTGASDNALMDNIIKAKIGDALRWVCLYGPADLLSGCDETDVPSGTTAGVLVDYNPTVEAVSGGGGRITLPSDFIKLARVRVDGWHRAIKVPVSEDSEEYLQLYDSYGAAATSDRPQAAIIDKAERELEVWPWSSGKTVDVTYVIDTEGETYNVTIGGVSVEKIAIPPKSKTAFIYYLAFLLLSAYNDARSARMLEIAKMNLTGVAKQ